MHLFQWPVPNPHQFKSGTISSGASKCAQTIGSSKTMHFSNCIASAQAKDAPNKKTSLSGERHTAVPYMQLKHKVQITTNSQ